MVYKDKDVHMSAHWEWFSVSRYFFKGDKPC